MPLEDGCKLRVHLCLELQPADEVLLRDGGGLARERDRVCRQLGLVLGHHLGDDRSEDRPEMRTSGATDLQRIPAELHLLHERAALAQGVRSSERVGRDNLVDLVAAEIDGEREAPPVDPAQRAGMRRFGRRLAPSDGCGPAMTFSSSAQSATVRARGPS